MSIISWVEPVVEPLQYPLPPTSASDDLNNHPELSARRSSCTSIRVIVLHPYTKVKACRPSHSEDMVTALSSLVTLTFDLLTLGLVQNVSHGTDNVAANFGASVTFHCRIMGKQESDWRYDLMTLTSDVTANVSHTGDCTPSLYQVWSSSVSPSEHMVHFPSQH